MLNRGNKNLLQWLALALAAVVLVGCETIQKRIERNQPYFDSLPLPHQILIRAGKIQRGFTAEEVYLAWGNPARKSTSEDARGMGETWTYTYTRTYTYYHTVPHWDRRTGRWFYIDEPHYVYYRFIDKEVTFFNGRVEEWTIHSEPIPFDVRHSPW